MINRAFAEVMMEGDAKGRVFTFPIPTYNITKDFDWDNPNLENIWKMTGKYGIPYFSNFVNSDMSPEDARSMCCRLRLDNRELHETRRRTVRRQSPDRFHRCGDHQSAPNRLSCQKRKGIFCSVSESWSNIAKASLVIKRKVLEKFTEQNLYPYSKFYLRNIKEQSGNYWNNHFSTIGIIGMNEACLNFIWERISAARKAVRLPWKSGFSARPD